MAKPTTSANANVDFNIADLINVITNFGIQGRNNLAVVIENGTEIEFDVNFQVNRGVYHASHGSNILGAVPFQEGDSPQATNYEIAFEAEGAGCNVVLALTKKGSTDPSYWIMAATPVNKDNYFKWSTSSDVDSQDKNYSSNGFKDFDDGNLQFEISITGSSPAVCTVTIAEV